MKNPRLNIEPNFVDADAFYAALADVYRDVSDDEAERISARLILLLANQIGDVDTLSEALIIAADLRE